MGVSIYQAKIIILIKCISQELDYLIKIGKFSLDNFVILHLINQFFQSIK